LRVQGCGYVRSLHLSPARLVAVGWGGEIEVRSPLQQGRHLCSLKYNNLLYCSSATEDTLISGSMDSTIQVWDFSRGTVPLATDLD
jgi:WD40 repeat protein